MPPVTNSLTMDLWAENPFFPGDPVQATGNPNMLGKVLRVTEGWCDWTGRPMQPHLVYVQWGRAEIAYYPEELHVCKCAARIPEGVSQCQK